MSSDSKTTKVDISKLKKGDIAVFRCGGTGVVDWSDRLLDDERKFRVRFDGYTFIIYEKNGKLAYQDENYPDLLDVVEVRCLKKQ